MPVLEVHLINVRRMSTGAGRSDRRAS
jgi:hypothetical protein